MIMSEINKSYNKKSTKPAGKRSVPKRTAPSNRPVSSVTKPSSSMAKKKRVVSSAAPKRQAVTSSAGRRTSTASSSPRPKPSPTDRRSAPPARLNPNAVKSTAPNGKRRKKKTKFSIVKKALSVTLSTILSIFMIGIITVTICCTALTVWVLEFKDSSDDVSIAPINVNTDTFFYAKNPTTGELITVHQVVNSNPIIPIDIQDLPQHVCDAFVYTEDERFYSHDGVDYKRTFAAFLNVFLPIYENRQGGSTITQQLIKNLTGDDEQSADRKIREIFRAMQLEKNYTKNDILEGYMNYIEYGNGYAGIEIASNRYFGKSAKDLTIAEAATLAAIPKNPEVLNPFRNFKANQERKEYVIYKMYENGAISYDEYILALNEKIILTNSEEYKQLHPELNEETETPPSATTWYVDAAIYEVADYFMKEYGISQSEAIAKLNSGGYKVYTTVDLNMQNFVEEKYLHQENFSTIQNEYGEYPQSSFIAMNYYGEILAIVGQIGDKNQLGSLCSNYPIQAYRDPGSTMKPIASYGKALEDNFIHWSTPFYDNPIKVDGESWPKNYSGSTSGAQFLTVVALQRSLNTIPAQLVDRIGLREVFTFATENMGLELVERTDDGKTDISHSPLALGGLTRGIPLKNLVNAYIPYGNGGTYYKAHIVSKVENSDGTLLYSNEPNSQNSHTAVSQETAYIMNKLLQEVVKDGTGTAAALPNKTVAGKTGTSQDWRDLSFVGLTEDFVSGVWIGYETPTTLPYRSLPSSASLWKMVIGDYANSVQSSNTYPPCPSVVELRYCTQTGLIAGPSCPSAVGYYKPSNIPATCSGHATPPPESTPVEGPVVDNAVPLA